MRAMRKEVGSKMENTEADEERIALLLHNGTLVLQMKDLRKEVHLELRIGKIPCSQLKIDLGTQETPSSPSSRWVKIRI